jgi:putative flavoprotein involved in K+ transport
MWWRNQMGSYDQLVEHLPSPAAKFACNPHVSGKNGGHDINLRQLAREGVVLLGRLQAIKGNRVILAPDLEENLAKADAFATQEIQAIDAYIEQTGMEVVEESMTEQPHPNGTLAVEPVLALDLQALGLSTVIWATGYQLNFSWVQVPVFDKAGHPLHQRGVTAIPGLYFLGLPWQYKRKSSLLFGIGEDAAFLASVIAARR